MKTEDIATEELTKQAAKDELMRRLEIRLSRWAARNLVRYVIEDRGASQEDVLWLYSAATIPHGGLCGCPVSMRLLYATPESNGRASGFRSEAIQAAVTEYAIEMMNDDDDDKEQGT